jgi:hypothetical protein
MPATMTTIDAITKEMYQGDIQDQLQSEVTALKRLERSGDGIRSEVGGKYVVFPIRTKRNQGIGSRNELEALPVAGQQGFARGTVSLKYDYGRVKMSGQTMELADSNPQAFSDALDLEMDGLKNDLLKNANRQVFGTSLGTLATVTADAANTVTVNSIKYLEVGQQIDIVTPAGVSHAANRQITAINESTNVVTYDGADASASVVATDIIVRQGSWNREVSGFAASIAASGTIYGIDPTVTTQWKSTVDSNAGVNRPLSEGLMITMTDNVRKKGGKTSLIITSLGVRRAYFNLLSQQRRYTNTTEFEGGVRGLAFNNGREIPVVEDVDAPDNTMYFIDESKFKVYQDHDFKFMQRDGNIWKWVTDYDAYEAVMNKYWEIATNQRNAHGVIADITEG